MKLLVFDSNQKKEIRLEDFSKDSVTFGRASNQDIVLSDNNISRTHGIFQKNDGVWYVVDNGSRNGIAVNGTVINGSCPLYTDNYISLSASNQADAVRIDVIDDEYGVHSDRIHDARSTNRYLRMTSEQTEVLAQTGVMPVYESEQVSQSTGFRDVSYASQSSKAGNQNSAASYGYTSSYASNSVSENNASHMENYDTSINSNKGSSIDYNRFSSSNQMNNSMYSQSIPNGNPGIKENDYAEKKRINFIALIGISCGLFVILLIIFFLTFWIIRLNKEINEIKKEEIVTTSISTEVKTTTENTTEEITESTTTISETTETTTEMTTQTTEATTVTTEAITEAKTEEVTTEATTVEVETQTDDSSETSNESSNDNSSGGESQ